MERMTITGVTVGEIAQLLTSIAVVGSWIQSWRNSKKIDEVHKSTNGLAMRNEAIAEKLGIAKGKQQEKDNPS
jgi:hypothetical protein